MRRTLSTLVVVSSAIVVLVGAPSAAADDTPCVGTLTGTHDNVVVPPGQTCILSAATVAGNVKALENSRLRVTASNVGGNVEGDKANIVQVDASTVRENIIIKEAGPGPAGPFIPGFFSCEFGFALTPCEAFVDNTTVVNGNIQLEKIQGTAWVASSGVLSPIRGNIKVEETLSSPIAEFMAVTNSQVDQNLQVFKNKGPGNKLVSGNRVGEDLQCFENDSPFTSSGNFARQAQGQCTAAPLPMSFAARLSAPVAILGPNNTSRSR